MPVESASSLRLRSYAFDTVFPNSQQQATQGVAAAWADEVSCFFPCRLCRTRLGDFVESDPAFYVVPREIGDMVARAHSIGLVILAMQRLHHRSASAPLAPASFDGRLGTLRHECVCDVRRGDDRHADRRGWGASH